MMQISEQLIELLAEHTGKPIADITVDTSFESLGIDSLDTVELVMNLEEKLDIELELNEKVNTVGEMVAILETKVKG